MVSFEVKQIPDLIAQRQVYTFSHHGDGHLEPIISYNRSEGIIRCGTDRWSDHTYSVCASDTCYVFSSNQDRIDFEAEMKEKLAESRKPRIIIVSEGSQ